MERNRKVLDRRRSLGNGHGHARQLFRLVLVRNPPFAGVLADNQRPLVCSWNREDRVTTSGNVRSLGRGKVLINHERGRIIRSGAPDFAIRYKSAEDLTSLRTRAGIIHGDGFAVGKFALRLRGWTGALALVLLGGGEDSAFQHSFSLRNQQFSLRLMALD